MSRIYCGPVSLFFIIAMLGCGGDGETIPRIPTVPVSGNVTLDGKAFGPGTIQFMSTAQPGTPYHNGVGHVASDGSFEAGSYEEADGLVPGEYQVMLVPSTEDPTAQQISVQSLTVTIPEAGDDAMSLTLQSDPNSTDKGLLSSKLEAGRDTTAIGAGPPPR